MKITRRGCAYVLPGNSSGPVFSWHGVGGGNVYLGGRTLFAGNYYLDL